MDQLSNIKNAKDNAPRRVLAQFHDSVLSKTAQQDKYKECGPEERCPLDEYTLNQTSHCQSQEQTQANLVAAGKDAQRKPGKQGSGTESQSHKADRASEWNVIQRARAIVNKLHSGQ